MTIHIDLQQLARRENEQTEWKENVADINDLVATLCAFAAVMSCAALPKRRTSTDSPRCCARD